MSSDTPSTTESSNPESSNPEASNPRTEPEHAAPTGGGEAETAEAREKRSIDAAYGHTPDRTLTGVARDGTVLHIEVDEPTGGSKGPTVVLCHGFCMDLRAWVLQRRALVASGHRVVTWDQRGHGSSEEGEASHGTIDELGRDLRVVLDAAAPEGPLVLIGHSMGGMTIMSLAAHYPTLIRERVVAVGIVSSSAGGNSMVKLGLGPIADLAVVRLGPGVLTNLSRRGELWAKVRRAGRIVETRATQQYGFGAPMPRRMLRFVSDMVFGTPLSTIGTFIPELENLDVREGLAALLSEETAPRVLIVNGTRDRLTPPEHSSEMAAALPEAEHIVVPGAGHLLPLERPDVLNPAILALVEAVTPSKRSPGRKRGAA